LAKKQKRITRRNKTTGEVHYYYYAILGRKNGKQILSRELGSEREYYLERGANVRRSLNAEEVYALLDELSVEPDVKRYIELRMSGTPNRNAITYTRESLEGVVRKRKMNRTENFLAQLGYSMREFTEEFGVSEDFVQTNGFAKVDAHTYQLRGTDLYFVWDYDRGMVRA